MIFSVTTKIVNLSESERAVMRVTKLKVEEENKRNKNKIREKMKSRRI
jgi:hypothetical protein